MHLNFSAGGTADAVRRDVELQLQQQLVRLPEIPGRDELTAAITGFVDRQIDDVAPEASVSVSGNVSIYVARPPRASVAVLDAAAGPQELPAE